jgi:hypothetical protein
MPVSAQVWPPPAGFGLAGLHKNLFLGSYFLSSNNIMPNVLFTCVFFSWRFVVSFFLGPIHVSWHISSTISEFNPLYGYHNRQIMEYYKKITKKHEIYFDFIYHSYVWQANIHTRPCPVWYAKPSTIIDLKKSITLQERIEVAIALI